MPTITNLENTAKWFLNLALNAWKAFLKYWKVVRKMKKASKATTAAMEADRDAHKFAAQLLGGNAIVSNGTAQPIPEVNPDPEAQRERFKNWMDFLQNDPDLNGEDSSEEE